MTRYGEAGRWAPALLLSGFIVAPLSAMNVSGTHSSAWGSIFIIWLAATLVMHSVDSLRTGRAAGRPFTADRVREPGWFWAHVVLHFVLAAALLLTLPVLWRD